MKILVACWQAYGGTAEHRLRALRRLFGEVELLAYDDYLGQGALSNFLTNRLQFSAGVLRLNEALMALARRQSFDYILMDKPIYFDATTVRGLVATGARPVALNLDDPFGPRRDPVWRRFRPTVSAYWAHVVPREVTRKDLLVRGAKRVALIPFPFEPSIHFPATWLDLATRWEYDVSFVGFPHDDRVSWLEKIGQANRGVRFAVFGPRWNEGSRRRLAAAGVQVHGPVWNDQYRDVAWRSALSLSFITRSNRDEMSHKAIEIAACGCAVALEPSPVHDRTFQDGVSAVFFQSVDDLAQRLPAILADQARLRQIGAQAASAVRKAGLSNDEILARVFSELEGFRAQETST
jgi:hypothetical protein